ncbi:MAG: hypothetical protein ACPGXX_15485 [Planctomycetaceae bacterium]
MTRQFQHVAVVVTAALRTPHCQAIVWAATARLLRRIAFCPLFAEADLAGDSER